MHENFGNNVRAARKMAGLSLQTVADAIGVTKQAVSKYEQGAMLPDSEVLMRLAALLRVRSAFFFRERGAPLTCLEFRKHTAFSKKEQHRLVGLATDHMRRVAELHAILGLPLEFVNPIGPCVVGTPAEAGAAAAELRRQWNLGDGPIHALLRALEEKGIWILEPEMEGDYDGVAALQGSVPIIVLKPSIDVVRKRFTALHELAHLLLPAVAARSRMEKESLCNRFAGTLLLPDEAVTAFFGKQRSAIYKQEIDEVRQRYGISAAATMRRLLDLGVITDSAYRQFHVALNKDRMENGFAPYGGREAPGRFKQLVLDAVSRDIITMSKGAELLDVSLSRFRAELVPL